ncbi:MAG: hypothetical protein ACLVML_08350 [Candidatus Gastranaerophilaceae bacterium]|nr:hypothetical protein [Christensenellales bacterium]
MKKKGLIVIIALAAIISADLIFNLTAKRPDSPKNNDASATPGTAGYDFSSLATDPVALEKRIDEFVINVSEVEVFTEYGYDTPTRPDQLFPEDQAFLEWLKQNPQLGITMDLNKYGLPLQIGDWIKGPDSYDHMDDIARINDEEEKKPLGTTSPEVIASLQEQKEAREALIKLLDEIDYEAAEIYSSYNNGEQLNVLTRNKDEYKQNAEKMLALLDRKVVNYEEFDTIYRFFVRRFYTINLEFPELAEERDAVMEACIEHYNYEYIPNGTEGKSDGFR